MRSNNTRDIREGYTTVAAARTHLKTWKLRKHKVSERTESQYSAACRRLLDGTKTLDEITSTKRTYYYYRAAINHFGPQYLDARLREYNKLSSGTKQWWASVEHLEKMVSWLERFPADPALKNIGKDIAEIETETWCNVKPERMKSSQSKRKVLPLLPDDWKAEVFERLPEKITHKRSPATAGELRTAVALLSAAGCRPDELERGVTFRVIKGQLAIQIKGSKTGEHAGQEIRRLLCRIDTPWTECLAKLAGSGIGHCSVPAKWLNDRVRRIGEKCSFAGKLQKRGLSLSPYVYRHALSASIKAEGWDEEQIAMAMGHRVTKTQQYYGTRRQGKGGSGLVKATASQSIKQTRSSPEARVKNTRSKLRPSTQLKHSDQDG